MHIGPVIKAYIDRIPCDPPGRKSAKKRYSVVPPISPTSLTSECLILRLLTRSLANEHGGKNTVKDR
ncbi:hypothetical protein SERLADRAFT_452981 [Serpula lacrymans var. lacrymans S7.9]|uniref:Uncharacterized protein n=1 Tax=Serpula lacrymans var. lacrymans (strain S7.9) TaxID=578457 RepID=F8P9H3_SERL9|nr:uncharacterized protein SERLADRAFT_452981 [Serpula lacrymans var. lacrymans S7.9]EGO20302.1 hypothetical protein SERLADRAFT_452981 [Serpula lacrymans var. lacrymans S7.9]